MTPALRAIVDEAYRVFAPYTIGSTLSVCNCNVCMSKEIERELAATPLREIPSSLLAEYTSSAHTWDDDRIAREMRHFLPRYLELIAIGDPPDSMGLDICLRRLGYAGWRRTWPTEQSGLLQRFFDELMADSLHRLDIAMWPRGPTLAFDLVDVLTLVITAGGEIDRVLAVWDAAADPLASLHMASIRWRVHREAGRDYLHSAYLDDNPAAADRIGAFLLRPVVDARIEAAFFAVDNPQHQQILSEAAWSCPGFAPG